MFVKEILRGVVSNSISILLVSLILSGFIVQYSPIVVLTGGLVLSLVNYFVKPILKLISFPINLVTLGFFNFVINVALLYAVVYIVDGIEIKNSVLDLSIINYSDIYLSWVFTLILAAFLLNFFNTLIRKILY